MFRPETIAQTVNGRMALYGCNRLLDIMKTYPWTPFDFYRMSGQFFGRRGLYNGLKRRVDPAIFEGGDEEINNLTTYVYQMMVRKKSSELCLGRLMAPFAYTWVALEPLLPQLKDKMPMAFIYGEFDWVNRAPADNLIEKGLIQGEVFQTENSGHHLYIEAAEECVACILKFKYDRQTAEQFIESVV